MKARNRRAISSSNGRNCEVTWTTTRYRDILPRFEYQAKEAIVWRDTICNWIYAFSGIPDQKGRVATAIVFSARH